MKHFTKIIMTVIIFSFFVGCSSKDDPNTITFAGGGVGLEEEVTREQIKLFEKETGIKVNYKVMPNSATERHDIFVTHLSAGDSSIDVYMIDIIWPAEFAAAGWIVPLDNHLSKEDRTDYIPSTLSGCTYNNKLYAIPWFVTTGLIYYRKDLLKKEGLNPPKNWSELVKQAHLISKKYNMDGFLWQGAQYEGLICDFLEFIWSNGAEVFNKKGQVVLNSPNARGALQFMKDTFEKDKISPKGTITYKEEDTRQIFQDGKAVFLRNWPYVWALAQSDDSKIKDKVGVITILPGPQGKKGVGCIGGWNLAISQFSKKKAKAIQFIKFVTSSKQQISRGIKAGQAPSSKSAYLNKDLLKTNPLYKNFIVAVEKSRPRPQTPFYSDLSEILQIYVSKALSDQMSVEEALATAEKEIKKLISKAEQK